MKLILIACLSVTAGAEFESTNAILNISYNNWVNIKFKVNMKW